MSVKPIRASNFQSPNLNEMIQSLEKVSVTDDIEDYFKRCAEAVHLAPEIEFKEKKSFSGCCGLSFNNVCQKVSCCSIRCFGQDVYNISGYVDDSGTIRLKKKSTRRELSEDDNKFTNACFYLKLSKTYGADLPLLLKWTFALLPPATASYWKTWNMISVEPLDREKADNLSRTIKKVFDLRTSLRIEMLKDDLVKTFSSPFPLKQPSVKYVHPLESSIENEDYLDVSKSQEVVQEQVLAFCSLARKLSDEWIKDNPIKEQEIEITQASTFSRQKADVVDDRGCIMEKGDSELEVYKSSACEESSPSLNDNQVRRVHRSASYELALEATRVFKVSTREDLDDIQAEMAPEQLPRIPIKYSSESINSVKSLEPIPKSPIRRVQKKFQAIVRRVMHRPSRSNMSSYIDSNLFRSNMQVEVNPEEKQICAGDGYVKFNPEIIISDVRLITGCSREKAEIIANSVKQHVTETTTLHEIWGLVKSEIRSNNIPIEIKPDPRFKRVTDCEVQTVGEVPIEMVSDLFKNKAFKKKLDEIRSGNFK